ncbi:MAG: methyltransferase domain-containing protein [Gammaproteobacteria bacterium]|nr:methyltransferase domain-containing protein [Gammaproteobacteria bacterium]
MSDTSSTDSVLKINDAISFDYNADKMRDYYDNWAIDYNRHVEQEKYEGPEIIANFLSELIEQDKLRYSSPILDAGCGTGLIGKALHNKNFVLIDGFDLSARMASKAQESGAYRQVLGDIDIMQVGRHYLHDKYSCIVSCGVFTLGHVHPQALVELIQLCQRGGYIVLSTRNHYLEGTDYASFSQQLIDNGQLILIEAHKDQPYTSMDKATYWIYRKPHRARF